MIRGTINSKIKLDYTDWSLFFVFFSIFFQRVRLFDSPYLSIDYISLYIYIFLSLFSFKSSFNFKNVTGILYPIILFVLVYITPSIWPQDFVHPAINSYIRNMFLLCFSFILIVNHLYKKPQLLRYILPVLFTGLVLLLINYFVEMVNNFSFGTRRRSVLGLNVNDLSFFASIGILLSIFYIHKIGKNVYINVILICSYLFIILNTGSRGGALILPVVVFLYFYFSYKGNIIKKSFYLSFVVIIIAIMLYLLFNFGTTSDRLSTSFEVTDRGTIELLHDRIPMWEVAYRTRSDNLLFGAGGHKYALELRSLGRPFQNVHNEFLHIFVFGGLLGLLIFIYILYKIGVVIFCVENIYYPLIISLFVLILFQLTKGGGVIHSLYTWVLLSWVYAISIKSKESNKNYDD